MIKDHEVRGKILSLLDKGSAHQAEILGYLYDVQPFVVLHNLSLLQRSGAIAEERGTYRIAPLIVKVQAPEQDW